MTALELLGMVGLASGAVSGGIGVLVAYAELRRWRRLRCARRRLLAMREREDRRAGLAVVGDELGAVEFVWPPNGGARA